MALTLPQNYFELFQLPCAPVVDTQQLTERYRALQHELHPDRYATAPDSERRLAAAAAAHVNQAYQILGDRHARAIYLLELQEITIDDERDTSQDAEFLMHQMELHEQIEELGTAAEVAEFEALLEREEETLWEAFQANYQQQQWEGARDTLLKLRFYRRLKRQTGELQVRMPAA